MVVKNNLVNAAIKKYEAQVEEALATLHIYFNDSVGIGDGKVKPEPIKKFSLYGEEI
jgi:hypothetical protein